MALTNIDTATVNPKYSKFLEVVMDSEFENIAKTQPYLKKWHDLFNAKPEKYLEINRYSLDKRVKIYSIFTDTLLLKSICNN